MLRTWWFWFGVACLLLLAGFLGLRAYLTSSRLAGHVASRFQELTGEQADLDSIDVGLGGTQARGLRLYESGRDRPWLVVDELETDLSLARVVQGDVVPERIAANHARLTLRFDARGNLLTRIPVPTTDTASPSRLPVVVVTNACVVLEQEGRPPAFLQVAQMRLESGTIQGAVVDPEWGEWNVGGTLDISAKVFRLTLATPRVRVTSALLQRLPFVPTMVWENLTGEGELAVELAVDFLPEFHYRADLRPLDASIHLAAIDLTIQAARGKAIVDDGIVRIEEAKGQAAEGVLSGVGEIDLIADPGVLTFRVAAKDLELAKLPTKWKLPPQLEGKLSGEADLRIEVDGEQRRLSGEGKGEVSQARLAGQPVKPIQIELRAEPDRFVIRSVEPRLGLLHCVGGAVQLACRHAEPALRLASAMLQNQPALPMLDVALEMEDGDLGDLLCRFDRKRACRIDGRFALWIRLTIPIDAPHDPARYRIDGHVLLRDVTIDPVRFQVIEARLHGRDGVLLVDQILARPANAPDSTASQDTSPYAGTITGSVRLPLCGDLDARLRWRNVRLECPNVAVGPIDADVRVSCDIDRLHDTSAWKGEGFISLPTLGMPQECVEVVLRDLRAIAILADGRLELPLVDARLAGSRVVGSIGVHLNSPFPYAARFDLHDADIEMWSSRLLTGRGDMTADAHGQLDPFVFEAAGTVRARALCLDSSALGSGHARWKADRNRVHVHALQASIAGGNVRGEAVFPIHAHESGKLDLTFDSIDLGTIVTALFPMTELPIVGAVHGSLAAMLAPGENRRWKAQLRAAGDRVALAGIPIDGLRVSATVANGRCTYEAKGTALDGDFEIAGVQALDESGELQGRIRLDRARLGRVWKPWRVRDTLTLLDGIVSAVLEYHGGDHPNAGVFGLEGVGRIQFERLAWGRQEWASQLEGDLELSGGRLRLLGLTGNLGTGEVDGSAVYDRSDPSRSGFALSLRRVEVGELLRPWASAAGLLDGLIDVQVRGAFGKNLFGSALIAMPRGTVGGIPFTELRLPVRWSIVAETGSVEMHGHDVGLQLANGRLTASTALRLGQIKRFDSRLRFHGIDSRALFQALGMSRMSAGELAGRAELMADDLRSPDDLQGRFELQLSQVRGSDAPVLQQILPFLALTRGSAASFRTGNLRAQLHRGVIRLERCHLISPVLRLSITGTATLAGRLDLELAANSQNLAPLRFLRLEGISPSLANRLLADRLVYLHVGGTTTAPTIRFRPLPFLADEAIRFFLGS